jgi:hypothetical protein
MNKLRIEVADLGRILFACLRLMDAEAITVRDGAVTGLSWYGAHSQHGRPKPRTEPEWIVRLAHLLEELGVHTIREAIYPALEESRKKRCDLLMYMPTGEKVWVEVKGAWKEYWGNHNEWIYRSYLLHPLVPSLDQAKTHTVPLDLEKLAVLHKPEADHVGMLLVGFDSTTAPMDDDVRELCRLAGLDHEPWQMLTDGWDDARRPSGRVRCWLWMRPAPPQACV